MGRLMVPSTPATRGEVDLADASQVIAGPDGRFYLPSEDAKAEKARVSDPVEAAALFAGQPPTKEETRAAKKEQLAAEKAAEPVTPEDPAAETVVDEPVKSAGEQATEPPGQAPGANASRADWEAYARTRGATDDDLVFEDRPLTRNELRDKYGLI